MNYTEEDKEDKKYKKGYSKKEFKKDVQEAVEPVMKKMAKKKKPTISRTKKGAYSNMSAGELRTFLQQKKKALLTKSGFPDGKIPKGRDAMVALCKKLKRKRW
jgi:hypothetical protein